MIINLPNERWKQFVFKNSRTLQKNYAISSMGRFASYTTSLKKDGIVLDGSLTGGYKIIRMKVKDKYIAFLVHKIVAEYFVKRPSSKHTFVIHLDHNKLDNRAANLRWATSEEVTLHNMDNPVVIAAKKKASLRAIELKKGRKLTLAQVKKMKHMLGNARRKLTYKQIAEKFGISEMAITRIKRGENWAAVKV
jgi:hypothetical protein